jgi:hypothetical protein
MNWWRRDISYYRTWLEPDGPSGVADEHAQVSVRFNDTHQLLIERSYLAHRVAADEHAMELASFTGFALELIPHVAKP